jgi:hypothetical protein
MLVLYSHLGSRGLTAETGSLSALFPANAGATFAVLASEEGP